LRTFKIYSDADGKSNKNRIAGMIKRKKLREILDFLGVKSLVVGHAVTPDKRIILEHPYYKDMVQMIDTGIARHNGRLSALEIHGSEIKSHLFKDNETACAKLISDKKIN
ncbi:MAG: hypothetical protein KDD22_08585, partial [Bdellovibrionales bacterium]|nr:hypothetical protein [Bdellovibrionales bacterium]